MSENDSLIDDESSLNFLVGYLKDIIKQKEDRDITKVSDIADLLSDFLSTFVIIIDSLVNTVNKKFEESDRKIAEFENLLLKSAITGLQSFHQAEAAPIRRRPISTKTPPPPPKTAASQISGSSSPATPSEPMKEVDLTSADLEDVAKFAFTKKSVQEAPPVVGISMRMSLLDELKKKFTTVDSEKKEGESEKKED